MKKSPSKQTVITQKRDPLTDVNPDISFQGEDFYQMVSEAAYYKAEKRNFVSGFEMEDWVEAEAEIIELQKESLVA